MIGIGYIRRWAVILDHRVPGGKNFVSGFVYEHPNFKDGTLIITSIIVGAEGRNFVTRSGSCYTLEGAPAEGWLKARLDENPRFNLDNPFPNLSEAPCKTNNNDVE